MVRNNVRIRGKLGSLISLVVIVGLILAQIPPGIVSAQTTNSGDWPSYRFDPAGTAFAATETDLIPPLTQISFQAINSILNPGTVPILSGGYILISEDGGVCAYHLSEQSQVWCYNGLSNLQVSGVTSSEVLLAGTNQVDSVVNLVKLSLPDGSLLGEMSLGISGINGFNCSAPSGNRVFCSAESSLRAADISAGSIVWSSDLDANGVTPVVLGDTVYASTGSSVYAFNKDDGQVLWNSSSAGGTSVHPVAFENLLILAGNDGTFHALNTNTSEEEWNQLSPGGNPCLSAYGDGSLLVTTSSGIISRFDVATGDVLWNYDPGTGELGTCLAPVLANGYAYAAYPDGMVRALDITDGSLVWEESVAYAGSNIGLAISNGMLVVPVSPSQVVFYQSAGAAAVVPGDDLIVTAEETVYSITGTILDGAATGIPGVTVSSGLGYETLTLADGSYTISGLTPGDYTITPALPGYAFTPDTRLETIVATDLTSVDFTGEPVYSVSGVILDGTANGVAGVEVSDGEGHFAITDENGEYTVVGLPAGSYTLTPTKTGYTYTPVSQPVTLVDMDISGIDFTPSLAEIFSISGTILDSALAGVPGVMVSAGTVEDITASDGSYTLSDLTLGDHTITPMLAGYGFTPVSRLETISGTNLTAVDFTAEQVYSVSGLVTDGAGAGVEGVEIVIDAEHTTLTDLNGAYTIGNLPAGAYTLIPEKTDEIFTPTSLPVTLGPDATAVNFVQNNKIPIVTGFTPSFTGTGTSTITLTIDGENFVPDSQVLWNGNETTEYYISSTQLTFDALAADISASGQAQVTVINPEPGGGTSDIALFPVISHIPGQDQLLASSKVTFDWDDIPGATTYNIQLSLSSDFSTLVVQTPALSSSFAYSTALVNGKTYYWRIQPVYGTTPGEWSPAWRFYSMNPLPAPAPLLSPPSGSQTNNNTPEDPIVFTWTGVPNADKYNVQISRNYKFTDIVEDVVNVSGEPRYTTHSLTENRLYYWRVRAVDAVPVPGETAIDVPGAWSGYWTFTLDTQTPKAPVYYSPKDNAFTADTTPLLYMYKVTGATRYRFQVAAVDDVEGDDFEVPANIRLDTTVTVNYKTAPVLDYGEYYWRVQASDAAGNVSDWSTARKLTITFQQYPLEGYASRATMWGFSWYGIPGATAYRLEVTEDDGTLPENREDTYAYHSVDLGSLVRRSYLTLGLGNYLWRLRASTAGGDVVSPWRKMTVTTAPLAAPLLLNLTNGKSTNSHIPTLEWTAVPGAVKYELWVDNTLNFSTPEYKATVDAGTDPQVTHTLGDGSIDFSPADFIELANGLYYWKVRTINQYDVPGAWSGYFSFTVDDIAPGIPTLLTPANNSFTSDTSPTLSVNSVPGTSGYCFQADDSPVFAEPIIVNSICVITGRSVPTRVLDYGEYYWRAKAVDAAGNWSEWTPVYNRFEVTFQRSPAPGYVTTEQSPVLSWYAVAGALEYEVELALEADSDLEDPPLIALTEPKTTGLSYTLPNPGPGNYVWRVRASMDGGDPIISSWLPLTITDAPLAPPALESNVSPGSSIYTRSGTPTLSWHKVAGGAKYEIWVDNSRYFTSPDYIAVVEAAGGELETHTLGMPAVVNSPENFTGLPYGVYFWKMRTINQYGVPGAWSSFRYFMVDTIAPKEPVQYSPASNTVTTDTTPTLTVYSVAGASGYCFQADDSPVFDDPIIVNSGCMITGRSVPTHELSYGEYYWRAKAVDVAGNESGWSATRKLYLTYQLKPVDGSAFSDQTPTFTWNAIPGATAYKLEVMAGGIPIASHDLGQVTSYTLVTPLGFGEYTWRLRDNVSNTWTPEYTFYISAVTQDSPGGVYAGSTIYTGPPARARWIERFTVYAPQLRVKERAVSVYLPPDYATSGKSYPVIYLQDGISNFSAISGGSNVDGALEQLFASGEIEGVIAVAVEASGYRWDEYSPWYNYYMRSVWYAWTPNTVEGGEGDAYVHFLVDTLKPVIDARYRTLPDREHTAIGGSSMGGLIALYGAIQYPNVFSKVMALSPAVWFAEAGGYWLQNNRLLKSPFLLSSYFQDGYSFKDVDYFLYIGTSEWSGRRLWLRDSRGRLMSYPRVWLEGANAVYSTLKAKGVPLENLELVTYPGGTHGTGSWRIWEDDAMRWLFAGQTLPAGETPPPLEPGDGSLIAGYEIQFSKSTTFATVLESGEVWDGQLWYEPTSLEDGLHYWRVRSINDLGYRSPWSSAKSIVIDSTGPSVPKHLVPFNGVTLYGYPVFYWLGLADAAAYQFEYAISEDYDPVNGFSAPAFRSGELTKASYQPAFQASGTYYWHVRARDAAGNWGNWSAPFMVTISP